MDNDWFCPGGVHHDLQLNPYPVLFVGGPVIKSGIVKR